MPLLFGCPLLWVLKFHLNYMVYSNIVSLIAFKGVYPPGGYIATTDGSRYGEN